MDAGKRSIKIPLFLDIYFAEARFYDANNRTWLAIDPIKDGGNWYQYCFSNPTTYYDPNGLTVIAVGYDISEAFGIRVGIGVQIAFDDKGNIGLVKYSTIGGGFPTLGFGGGTVSLYSADEIWDLNGVGVAIGGGVNGTVLGLPISGSVEISFGSARDGSTVFGITGALKPEAAFPVDMHGVMVMTSVTKLNIPWEQVEPIRNTVMASHDDMHTIFQAYAGC